MSAGSSSRMKTYVCRFRPNQDLHKELDKFVKENDLKAAFIITCVGSLTKATLRMAYGGGETSERVKFKQK
jgi:predicted DNA-binding protein with PD1-like motif